MLRHSKFVVLRTSTNFEFELMNFSSRYINSNFAHTFDPFLSLYQLSVYRRWVCFVGMRTGVNFQSPKEGTIDK